MVKKKKKKTRKKNKLSAKDYRKLEKALDKYNSNQESENNSGYIIGVIVFIAFIVFKIIARSN
jgi:glucokinase